MPTTTPVWVAMTLFFGSLFSKLNHNPVRAERVELRVGHAIADNSEYQPSGFQLTLLLPSLDIPLTETIGPSWARGRIIWNPELQLGLWSYPYVRPLVGIHPLQFKYEFEPKDRWTLYGLSGWGGVYSNIDRPETATDGNFSLAIGGGVRYDVSDRQAVSLEYRHQHYSNYGSDDQNSGIDCHAILIGISYRL